MQPIRQKRLRSRRFSHRHSRHQRHRLRQRGQVLSRAGVQRSTVNDDWRVLPILTINAGVRWDYGAPMTELFGRLVNLDVANGFTAVAPVLGSDPVGPMTGDALSFFAHPPGPAHDPAAHRHQLAAHSRVHRRDRAGYGIYPDTSVYQNIILKWRSRPRSRRA